MAGDVEFLPDDAAQEPEPDDDGPGRRWRYRLAGAALVVAALAAWTLSRPDHHPSGTAAVRTVTATPTPTPTAAPRRHPLVTTMVVCTVGAPVATEINEAMLRFLPGIRVRNLSAYRCVRGSGASARIVYETIAGRYRGMVIGVETDLREGEPGRPVPGLLDDGAGHGAVLARVEAVAAGLHVAVTAYGGPRSVAPADAMRNLADFISLNVVL